MLVLKRQGAVNFLTHPSKHRQPLSLGRRLHRFTEMAAYLYNHNCKGFHAQAPIPHPNHRFAGLVRQIRNRKTSNLTVKCCFNSSNHNNNRVKGNVFENPNGRLVWDLDSELRRSQNGGFQGSLNGFHSQTLSRDKIVVAVDVDEVLGNFVSALNRFIADRYAANHTVSEYHVYEFFKIWKCSRDEADLRVHEFFKTSYFKTGIHPLPGAKETLNKLSGFCNLSVVTSRQNAIKDHTIQWIESHFPGLFQEIHFGNHFALHGESRPKSEICRSLGAKVLIDDNPRYALECAEVGIRVLLFDYENSYPWCKSDSVDLHPLVTRVHNWEAVEKQLLAWVTS
ncbi:putative 5'(3')-deoxyribonucleotidase, HAD-like domain-containing protein [Rosa chinensis]|uniref:Putative 5'(3')-deoxyribonucleotidase, HAD-like domain-containing protein n=1 Tax=Rosa chinensis TaxID=74649 RepID=A0A2P6RL61_ROSCH|nr:uncharacterized protein LOC112185874 [Rosa chinensis]PRQ47141.1 putative 5'(3')-deoxyribonucleotidase, HAD-like domain-containing protein [Rosa chinensis]